MSLLQLGPYPIEREVGRGGMGVVYLARDPRLGRPVAIKVLPDAFASDPERLARFEREARLLASLTHPNIAGIYGIEESGGRRFLALEYVEGETLAERLARGALPLDEAVDVCRQIASALEAAHEAGIVHRDLKPGNVKLTPGGDVKVLDFGLAKGAGAAAVDSNPDLSHSPTLAVGATSHGVILGTAAYMSPEQARGRAVDRRTDIWSFGCVLYECLTGSQAFAGETVSDMIARILQGEPDFSKLPKATPERLRALLARCLEKDAKRRLRDIGEARIELETLHAARTSAFTPGTTAGSATAPPRRRAGREIALTVAGAVLAAVAGVAATRMLDRGTSEAPPLRFTLQSPAGTELSYDPNDHAVSPDGSQLALAAVDSSGNAGLWLRPLGSFESRLLPGTRGASMPFWSPDGEQIGFFANGKLKRIRVEGGNPEIVCDAPEPRGATWNRRGDILLTPLSSGPIVRVRASGGTPVAVTVVDTAAGETCHRSPQFLPDGVHFTYVSIPERNGRVACWIGSLDSPRLRDSLFSAESAPLFAPPGHLIFVNHDALQAQRFDPRGRRLRGEPFSIGTAPLESQRTGSPRASVSSNGVLAWMSAGPRENELFVYDRAGREQSRLDVPADRWTIGLMSHDDRRAAVQKSVPGGTEIWVLDLERETISRLTYEGENTVPVWSPDDRRIAFASSREGVRNLFVRASDGSGADQVIHRSPAAFKYASDWTPDGSTILFHELRPGSGWDLLSVSMADDRATELLASPFNESYAFLSPDGRWMIYQSDESGVQQTWLCAYPSLTDRQLVVRSSTAFALWTDHGREIMVYRQDGMGLAVPVTVDRGGIKPGAPRELFRLEQSFDSLVPYRDGRRFLVSRRTVGSESGISVAVNWLGERGRKR